MDMAHTSDVYETLFLRLHKSPFRSRFVLRAVDKEYIARKGMDTIRRHAEDFVRTRLALTCNIQDGRQTPMKGHPVFIAQHACACCCRGCLYKWYGIAKDRELTDAEQKKDCEYPATVDRTTALREFIEDVRR